LIDVLPSWEETAEDYLRMTEGRKVLTLVLDMGGDILSRYPGRIENEEHPEFFTISGVTDLYMLNFAAHLKKKGHAAVLGVAAPGGDCELKETIFDYLQEFMQKGVIKGIIDPVAFYRGNYRVELLKQIENLPISSEVSRNYIKRIIKALTPGMCVCVNAIRGSRNARSGAVWTKKCCQNCI
jgi:hypothetical protein